MNIIEHRLISTTQKNSQTPQKAKKCGIVKVLDIKHTIKPICLLKKKKTGDFAEPRNGTSVMLLSLSKKADAMIFHACVQISQQLASFSCIQKSLHFQL